MINRSTRQAKAALAFTPLEIKLLNRLAPERISADSGRPSSLQSCLIQLARASAATRIMPVMPRQETRPLARLGRNVNPRNVNCIRGCRSARAYRLRSAFNVWAAAAWSSGARAVGGVLDCGSGNENLAGEEGPERKFSSFAAHPRTAAVCELAFRSAW